MTINCKGKLFDLGTPKIMGILNVTPDSFFDGGNYIHSDEIAKRASDIIEQGGDIIDIGGYSSRPGASDVAADTEQDRVVSAVKVVSELFPDAVISVDTFRSGTALAAIDAGASIVNDISAGLLDPEMIPSVASRQVPYVMMHMRGTPATMSGMTDYQDIIGEMMFYFSNRIRVAREAGINDLILDPGFGFAKTNEQNFEVLRRLDVFKTAGLPLLIGISRKSMVTKPLGIKTLEALNGTTALHMAALMKGASILRVHDVAEASQCVKVFGHLTDDDKVRYSGS